MKDEEAEKLEAQLQVQWWSSRGAPQHWPYWLTDWPALLLLSITKHYCYIVTVKWYRGYLCLLTVNFTVWLDWMQLQFCFWHNYQVISFSKSTFPHNLKYQGQSIYTTRLVFCLLQWFCLTDESEALFYRKPVVGCNWFTVCSCLIYFVPLISLIAVSVYISVLSEKLIYIIYCNFN